jgi:hypothetical protein
LVRSRDRERLDRALWNAWINRHRNLIRGFPLEIGQRVIEARGHVTRDEVGAIVEVGRQRRRGRNLRGRVRRGRLDSANAGDGEPEQGEAQPDPKQ